MSLRARLHRIVLSSPARNLLLTEPKFVVVGTGRSGTRYISKVLTAAGLKTGHEDWWNPHGRRVRTRLIGDASWCALFNLERYEGHVFHQIRDPMKVVSSLATTELNPLWPGKENELYYSWRMRNIDLSGEPLIDAMATVVRWVKESERCSEWTYRVEDIDEGIILELASRAGIKASREAVRSALQTVPTDTNQRLHSSITWGDLPDIELKYELLEISSRYGYR